MSIVNIVTGVTDPSPSSQTWILYVDGSSNSQGSSAGPILTTPTPDQVRIEYALYFSFLASNNEIEYEASLAGLRLAATMGTERYSSTMTHN